MKNQTPHIEASMLQKKITEIYQRFKPAPDNDDEASSPWSLIMQMALERTTHHLSRLEILGRFNPYIWEVIGDRMHRINTDFGYLNPQPIPPRQLLARVLAQVVVERTQLISDISEGLQEGSAEKTAGNFMAQFVDEICGTRPKIKIPPGWPWIWPQPEPEPDPRWQILELTTIAEVLIAASLHSNLKDTYQKADSKIIDTALSKT